MNIKKFKHYYIMKINYKKISKILMIKKKIINLFKKNHLL